MLQLIRVVFLSRFNQRSINGRRGWKKAWFYLNRSEALKERRMEDMMVKANDSLVTKQLEEEVADSGEIAAILNSGNIDTRTGLLNALVFWK